MTPTTVQPTGPDEKASLIFSPIKSRRTFETVIEKIIDAIDARGLSDGARLPNEGEMADMLGVSRPTLRQALRILEVSGVLTIKAGQAGGVFVTSGILPLSVIEQNISQEVSHVNELIATRRLLEPIVVHLAAENGTEEEFDSIASTIVLMEEHIKNPKMVLRADGMFHRRIAHAAGNEIMLRAISDVYRQLIPLRDALHNTDVEGARHMIEVHRSQLDAIRSRDHERLDLVLQESFVDLEVEFDVKTHYGLRWVAVEDRTGS